MRLTHEGKDLERTGTPSTVLAWLGEQDLERVRVNMARASACLPCKLAMRVIVQLGSSKGSTGQEVSLRHRTVSFLVFAIELLCLSLSPTSLTLR